MKVYERLLTLIRPYNGQNCGQNLIGNGEAFLRPITRPELSGVPDPWRLPCRVVRLNFDDAIRGLAEMLRQEQPLPEQPPE